MWEWMWLNWGCSDETSTQLLWPKRSKVKVAKEMSFKAFRTQSHGVPVQQDEPVKL